MNKKIKVRSKNLVRWLCQIFEGGSIYEATTGSLYYRIGNKEVRISDHVSLKKTPQVVFNPLNDIVLILDLTNHLNYMGKISQIKPILYSLIVMGFNPNGDSPVSKSEENPVIEKVIVTKPINPIEVTLDCDHKIPLDLFKKVCLSLTGEPYKDITGTLHTFLSCKCPNIKDQIKISFLSRNMDILTEKMWKNLTKRQYEILVQLFTKYNLFELCTKLNS